MLSIPKLKAGNQRFLFLFALILVAAIALPGCSQEERRLENLGLLDKAAQLMEGSPESALAALEGINSAYLEKDEYYYYMLVSTRISSMLGADVSDMEASVNSAVGYFIGVNNAQRTALAYYMQAKVFEANGQPENALTAYYNADWWAAKAEYNIPNFTYISIPYNIASYLKQANEYGKSLSYLKKTEYSSSVANDQSYSMLRLYSLELAGNNYTCLNQPDSSFHYYDRAFELADRMGATFAKKRIAANRIEMLSMLDDVQLAESEISKLLKEHNNITDSLFISLSNLSLARIYTKTNRLKQAYQYIDKAFAHINENDFDNQLIMYEQLVQLAELDSTYSIKADYVDFLEKLKLASKQAPYTKSRELSEQLREKAAELLSESMTQNESLFLTLLREKSIAYVGLGASLAMLAFMVVRVGRKKPNLNAVVEEAPIVEYILQSTLRESIEEKLTSYVLKQKSSSSEKEEILDCVEMYKSLCEVSVFDSFKKQLFGQEYETPLLTELELSVCYLMSTNRFEHFAIQDLLQIDQEKLIALIISLEYKMNRYGYKLPKGYHMARHRLKQLPEKYLRQQVRS